MKSRLAPMEFSCVITNWVLSDCRFLHSIGVHRQKFGFFSHLEIFRGGEGCKNQSCSEFDEESNGTGLAAKFEKKFFRPFTVVHSDT